MNLFKLVGEIVIKNQTANDALESTQDKAKQTGETISQSNKKTQESNASTGSSWSKLKSKVAEYKSQGMPTSQAWQKATQEMKSSTEDAGNGMTSAFKKIGAAVATYLTVDAIKNFGLGCIQAAADAGAMESQFSQVFGDLESKAGTSLTKIADNAGITENRMKGSFTKIAAFAKTTGMDTESALALSERAMVAVADSAAFYDRSLEETTESLQSFLKGNFENDAALGLSCTETTRNAAANKLYGKSFIELSESQKQLTLLQMVEDANKTSGALGQAARESDTWTNMTGNLKQAWTDFQAVLGSNVLPLAVDAVKGMVAVVEDWTAKLPELINWCKEHETTLTLIGIAAGTLAVAIGAYTIAQNAAAIATTVTTAATTAWGAVMAFVTSPITLVVLAIGALIAAGVALYKNWDEVSAFCAEKWTAIKEFVSTAVDNTKTAVSEKWDAVKEKTISAFNTAKEKASSAWNTLKENVSNTANSAKDSVSSAWSSLKDKTSTWFNNAKDSASTAFSNLKSKVVEYASSAGTTAGEKFNSMKSTISLAVSAAKSLASSAFESIKSTISTHVSSALTTVTSKFTAIKQAISDKLNEAWEIVQDIIAKVKKAFDFSIKLDIKLPHVSVSGGEAPYGIGGKGKLPSFSVQWYKKAYDEAMILSDPTIFGYSAASGKMLGGGDGNGNEVVAGETHLMNLIGHVVESKTAGQNDRIIEILLAILHAITGGNEELLRALLSGQKIVLNEREFARAVRTYA